MSITQYIQIGADALVAVGLLCSALQHLPLPAKWVERFARAATWASAAAVSVNSRKVKP